MSPACHLVTVPPGPLIALHHSEEGAPQYMHVTCLSPSHSTTRSTHHPSPLRGKGHPNTCMSPACHLVTVPPGPLITPHHSEEGAPHYMHVTCLSPSHSTTRSTHLLSPLRRKGYPTTCMPPACHLVTVLPGQLISPHHSEERGTPIHARHLPVT